MRSEGILPKEKATAIREKFDLKQQKVDAKNAKKRKDRADAKEVRDSSPEHFWQLNRKALANESQIAAYLEREQVVFDFLEDIRTVMEGREPDPEFITDLEAEIRADVAEHGICQIEVALLEFWKDREVFASIIQREGPTAIFARYGIVVAIPDHRLHAWNEWYSPRNLELQEREKVAQEVPDSSTLASPKTTPAKPDADTVFDSYGRVKTDG
jgi:hypothetical protein